MAGKRGRSIARDKSEALRVLASLVGVRVRIRVRFRVEFMVRFRG